MTINPCHFNIVMPGSYNGKKKKSQKKKKFRSDQAERVLREINPYKPTSGEVFSGDQ